MVRKPADAEAYQKVTLAKAERDSRISAAEAKAKEVELAAQANANRVKVEASAEAEHVRLEAAAKPFGSIDQMIVLNGAAGLSEALAQALSQGVAGLQLARSLLAGSTKGAATNGGGGEGSH